MPDSQTLYHFGIQTLSRLFTDFYKYFENYIISIIWNLHCFLDIFHKTNPAQTGYQRGLKSWINDRGMANRAKGGKIS
jgi:hypothetical protein